MCVCHTIDCDYIGGIDPSCPTHGYDARQRETRAAALEAQVERLEERVRALELALRHVGLLPRK